MKVRKVNKKMEKREKGRGKGVCRKKKSKGKK